MAAYCSGHPPCTRRQGTWGWLEQPTFFLSPANPSQVLYRKYGVRTAGMEHSTHLGRTGVFSGTSTWCFVAVFFFSLPRSGWGRNSATDGPTKGLAEWGSQCSGARSTHARVGGWDGTLAVISTAHGVLVAPLWTIMDNVAS